MALARLAKLDVAQAVATGQQADGPAGVASAVRTIVVSVAPVVGIVEIADQTRVATAPASNSRKLSLKS